MSIMYKYDKRRFPGGELNIIKLKAEKETEKTVTYWRPDFYERGAPRLKTIYMESSQHKVFHTFEEAIDYAKGVGRVRFAAAMKQLKEAENFQKVAQKMKEEDCHDITGTALQAKEKGIH